MTLPRASVVIVSRDRESDLTCCLRALEFQTYRPFEVTVVGDASAQAAIRALDLGGRVKFVECNRANVSHARNLGIAESGGEIVAFIDDDAIAEPTWLERLLAPLINEAAPAAGGFVLGRNGFDLQWSGARVGTDSLDRPLAVSDTTIFEADTDLAVRFCGTNMAFRRGLLVSLGGFDEAFAYYLDESDLCMRLAHAGHRVAIVPTAEVQHRYARNALRRADRAPLSLFEIGASTAVFLKRYHHDMMPLRIVTEAQKQRVIRAMIAGRIEPRDVGGLIKSLESGYDAGSVRESRFKEFLANDLFVPFRTGEVAQPMQYELRKRYRLFPGRIHAAATTAKAPRTILQFSLSTLFHKRGFDPRGFWYQTGGLFGRSQRRGPIVSFVGWKRRFLRETGELRQKRP